MIRLSLYLVYLLTLAVMCFYGKKYAYYDLDLAMYTGCVLEHENMNDEELHQSVYRLLQRDLPEQNWKKIIDSTNTYRRQLHEDAGLYKQQLIFYRVKPLYVQLLRLAYSAGHSPVTASVWLNIVCYMLTGLVLLVFLQQHVDFRLAFVTAFCAMLWPMVLDALRNNTPDMLATFLFLTGVLLLMSGRSSLHRTALVFFVLLVCVRVESLVFVLAFTGLAWWRNSGIYSRKFLLVLAALCTVTAGLVSTAYPLGWPLLYRHSMLGYVAELGSRSSALSIWEYLLGFKSLPRTLFVSDYSIMVLMLFLVYYFRKTVKPVLYLFATALLLYLLVRLLLLPDLCIRYYSGMFVLGLVLFVRSFFGADQRSPGLLKTS